MTSDFNASMLLHAIESSSIFGENINSTNSTNSSDTASSNMTWEVDLDNDLQKKAIIPMTTGQLAFVASVNGIIAVITTVVNVPVLVIWLVGSRWDYTPTSAVVLNLFIFDLSVAGALYLRVGVLLSAQMASNEYACLAHFGFLIYGGLGMQIFIFSPPMQLALTMAIVDRYIAVAYPFRYRDIVNYKVVTVTATCVHVYVGCVSFVALLPGANNSNGGRTNCTFNLVLTHAQCYFIVCSILFCMVVSLSLYARVLIIARGHLRKIAGIPAPVSDYKDQRQQWQKQQEIPTCSLSTNVVTSTCLKPIPENGERRAEGIGRDSNCSVEESCRNHEEIISKSTRLGSVGRTTPSRKEVSDPSYGYLGIKNESFPQDIGQNISHSERSVLNDSCSHGTTAWDSSSVADQAVWYDKSSTDRQEGVLEQDEKSQSKFDVFDSTACLNGNDKLLDSVSPSSWKSRGSLVSPTWTDFDSKLPSSDSHRENQEEKVHVKAQQTKPVETPNLSKMMCQAKKSEEENSFFPDLPCPSDAIKSSESHKDVSNTTFENCPVVSSLTEVKSKTRFFPIPKRLLSKFPFSSRAKQADPPTKQVYVKPDQPSEGDVSANCVSSVGHSARQSVPGLWFERGKRSGDMGQTTEGNPAMINTQVESASTRKAKLRQSGLANLLFCCCWFPFAVVQLFMLDDPRVNLLPINIASFLCMLNAILNPFIYVLGNKSMRRHVMNCLRGRRNSVSGIPVSY
ncbi:rhodopsin [Plakobranchus ocellatus]|uniref:Rhodopsin n=1 Tax=Plakobranchus ocellatus TaxID=259542 RepID=A0AAV4D635_9GAST|nr:rhodopsin [Plakobranchus ocellatus]